MPIRVLIADPDVVLVRSYREHLERWGFEVATANNGLECVARLRVFLPDVLVLEVDMPWGGGAGVLDMMHNGRELPRVQAMVLTARRHLAEFERQLLNGSLCDYHVKPLAPEQLADVIRTVLGFQPAAAGSWQTAGNTKKHRRADPGPKGTADAPPILCGLQPEGIEQ